MAKLKFTWDEEKAKKNLEKYGVSFEEAVTIFTDRALLTLDDAEHSQKEKREMAIGKTKAKRRLLTCFFNKTGSTIKLFAARRSTHREELEYDENSDPEFTVS